MIAKPKLAKEPAIHGESLNSPRQFFGVFKYSKRALELLWTTSKPLSLLLGFCTILAGVLPSGVAWVGARIVDSVYWATRALADNQTVDIMPTVWLGARRGLNPGFHHGRASRHHAVPGAAQGPARAPRQRHDPREGADTRPHALRGLRVLRQTHARATRGVEPAVVARHAHVRACSRTRLPFRASRCCSRDFRPGRCCILLFGGLPAFFAETQVLG